jgi:hypothetical protein
VIDEEIRYRHDAKKLADALMKVYYERGQLSVPQYQPEAERASASAT